MPAAPHSRGQQRRNASAREKPSAGARVRGLRATGCLRAAGQSRGVRPGLIGAALWPIRVRLQPCRSAGCDDDGIIRDVRPNNLEVVAFGIAQVCRAAGEKLRVDGGLGDPGARRTHMIGQPVDLLGALTEVRVAARLGGSAASRTKPANSGGLPSQHRQLTSPSPATQGNLPEQSRAAKRAARRDAKRTGERARFRNPCKTGNHHHCDFCRTKKDARAARARGKSEHTTTIGKQILISERR